MTIVANHEQCECTFIKECLATYRGEQHPAQIWRSPGGESYARVFFDDQNPKLYYRVLLSDIAITNL